MIEADPPRRLVHTLTLLWGDDVRGEGPSRVTWEIEAVGDSEQVARKLGIYLVNSVNPFRLEGQKTIMYRVLEALRGNRRLIVVPGGNLGNSSAFGKTFSELNHLGLIERVLRLAVINAAGAAPSTTSAAGTACAGRRRPDIDMTRTAITRDWTTRGAGLHHRQGDRNQPAGEFAEVRCER